MRKTTVVTKWLAWVLVVTLLPAFAPTFSLEARAETLPRTVVYDLNGGTGTAPYSTEYNPATYQTTISAIGDAATPPAGKQFAGWSPLKDGVANEWYAPGKSVIVSANGLTLYAMWTEKKDTYTVSFRPKVNLTDQIPDQEVNAGDPVTEPDPEPTHGGYTFVGWYKDSSFRYKWNFESDRVNSDLMLHAKWEQNDITPYTAVYHLLPDVKTDGGSGVPPASKEVAHTANGANVRVENILPNTTLEGKVFAGWSTSPARVLELKYRPGENTSDYVAVKYEGANLYDVWVDADPSYSNAVTVDFGETHQTMAGLGNALAFNKTSGYLQVFKKFKEAGVADADNPAMRALNLAVDADTGAKLEVFRAIIGDGGVTAPDINQATGEKYEWGNRYYDGPNDTIWPEPGEDNIIWNQTGWDTQKDKFDANQIWYIQQALKVNPNLKVYGAAWSAPYWMKTNLGVRNDLPYDPNGRDKTTYPLLDDAYYEDFATYLCEWAWGMYAWYGIPIYAVCPTNEPEIDHGYSAMVLRGDDYERFMLDYLKPKIQEYIDEGKFGASPVGAGTGDSAIAPIVGVAAPESTRIDRSTSAVDLGTPDRPGYGGMMAKDEIADMVSVFTTHMYENDHFLYEPRVADDNDTAYPAFMNKYDDIWMTEIGQQFPAYNAENVADNLSMVNGLFWARRIANEFASEPGFSSYILWNGTGSAGVTNDTARWINMLNAGSGQGTLASLTGQLRIYKRFYTVAQFSRFINPGDIRIGADRTPFEGANVTAYKSPDGNDFAIVVLNESNADQSISITLDGNSATTLIPYRTSDRENMKQLAPVAADGGAFTVDLPAMSMTTFVNDKGADNLPGMNMRDVFTILEAEDSDGQSASGVAAAADGVSVSNGAYIKYADFNFADGTGVPSTNLHVLRMKAGGNAGATASGELEVRVGAVDGRLVGAFPISPSEATDAEEYYAQLDTGDLGAYGIKDLYLVYNGTGELYLDKFTFDSVSAPVYNLLVNGLDTTANNTNGWTGTGITSSNLMYYRANMGRSLMVSGGGADKAVEADLKVLPKEGLTYKLNAFVMPRIPSQTKATAYESGYVNGGKAEAGLRFYSGGNLVATQEIVSRENIDNIDWRQITATFEYEAPEGVSFDSVKLAFTLEEDVDWFIDEVTLAYGGDPESIVADAKAALTWDVISRENSIDDVLTDLALVSTLEGADIEWQSDNKSVLYWDPSRPNIEPRWSGRRYPQAKDFVVKLTAVISCGDVSDTKEFNVTVKKGREMKVQDWTLPRLDMAAFMTEIGDVTQIGLVNAAAAQWSSSDASVATVDQSGRVTATGNGDATISAIVGDATLECIVSVGYAAQNPAFPPSWELYIADAEPHVYGDTLYVYGSHDTKVPVGSNYCSDDYHVVYTKDLVHWVDAGVAFTTADLPEEDDLKYRVPVLWAPDAFEYNGKYYLLSCGRDQDGEYFIAESSSPTGPFNQNVRRITYKGGPNDGQQIGNIDPGVLVDGNTVWLAMAGLEGQRRNYNEIFWPSKFRYGKLDVATATVDYTSIIETVHDVMEDKAEVTSPFEGPSLRKFGEWYYYIYVANNTKTGISPGKLDYLYTKDITKPDSWEYGGTFLSNNEFPNGGNVHGSVEYFKGKYYVTYHTSAQVVPTNGSARFFRIDEVTINPNTGRINLADMTSSGVRDAFGLDERIQAASLISAVPGVFARRDDADTLNYVPYPYIYLAAADRQVGYRYVDFKTGTDLLTLSVRTSGDGGQLAFSETSGGTAFAAAALPNTNSEWQEISVPITNSPTGVKEVYVRLQAAPSAGRADIDWFAFRTAETAPPPTPTTYTVSFDSQGGTIVSAITGVTEGAKISEPSAPTKTGNTFAGWYKETALTNQWNFAVDVVNADITLFAKWNQDSTPTPTPSPGTTPGKGQPTSNGSTADKPAGTESPAQTPDGGGTIVVTGPLSQFSDAASVSDWARPFIERLVQSGVLNGYADGTIGSKQNVTRAEFTKMIVTAFNMSAGAAAGSFSDVSEGAWYKSFVDIASSLNLINGTGGGYFSPDLHISRQDLSVIAYRAIQGRGITIPADASAAFIDDAQIADYAKEAVYALKTAGVISGRDTGAFDPSAPATREETAKILCGIVDYIAARAV
ncbi:MAG: InlB B-repeat-containing protein [Clostridiales Family XIII bacterium]|nr:InlB B-repeat-containing protein [Clostridiales Family XIII bacterium]